MKILIIEDDEDKLDQTRAFIKARFTDARLNIAKSLQSGLRAIVAEPCDLILLDMTMPNFDRTLREDGGRPHPFAGREILRQMRRNRIETPVVVLTHFDRFGEEGDYMTLDELKQDLRKSFPNYLGTVQFKGNVEEWRNALMEFLVSMHSSRPE